MALEELQQTLADLPKFGKLIKDRGYRQIWRFEVAGRGYFLKFYPRQGTFFKRLFRGSQARREFQRLQWLQKASIPAPHAIALLMGYRINGRIGDAVLLDAIEPSIQLDAYLNRQELAAERPPDHRKLSQQVTELIWRLNRNGLGHRDLHLGNMLLKDGRIYLLDAYAVRSGGVHRNDLLQLAHSVRRYATTSDLCRGWMDLGDGPFMPAVNPVSHRQWRKFIERIGGDNHYFGKLESRGWKGVFFKSFKYPYRWSAASQMQFTREMWENQWPKLLGAIESDALTVIKRSRSGDVLSGQIEIDGRTLEVVIKRPRRRYWYRYLNEIGRGSRPYRAWRKAWEMIIRNVPTAWPLMYMERRVLGYVVDAVIIFERVPGQTLATVDLDKIATADRDMLLRRTGRLLRLIDNFGFAHFDAKASNWIVLDDEKRGPTPVLIDVDGIRYRRWIALGIERLLRSMKEHPQYTVEDSLSLCQGYAPRSPLQREPSAPQSPQSPESPPQPPTGPSA